MKKLRRQLKEALQSSERDLQEAMNTLEMRVEERTSDLRQANEALRREVGKRRQAEAALFQSEMRYRTLVETSPDAICVFDQDGIVTVANQQAALLYESGNIGDIVGKHILNFLVPEDHERATSNVQRVLAGEKVQDEYTFLKKDGGHFCGETSAAAIEIIPDGPKEILVDIRDITERKLVESALKQSEEKFRTLFEESKDAIFICGLEGKLRDINPAGVELLGYPAKEELAGIDLFQEICVRPKDKRSFETALEERGYVKDHECMLRKRDGEERVISVTASAVRDGESNIEAYRGIMRDITEHKKMEQLLVKEESSENIGRLAGGVAHSLNNILTAVQGYLDMALSGLPEDSPVRDDLFEARKSSNRAANFTKELLLFSQRGPADLKPVDINQAIEELINLITCLFWGQFTLVTQLSPHLWRVEADLGLLHEAIVNLVVNARDAVPEGGKITIDTENKWISKSYAKGHPDAYAGKFVCLSISDTGAGIDASALPHIFDPFYSTKPAGTGLGLSVVYGIVRKHQGWIEAQSTPGAGSTFKLFFPTLPAETQE